MKDGAVALACTLLIGVIATAVMDLWGAVRQWLFGIPTLNYGLVGRWLVYLTRGRFLHDPIGASPLVPHEQVIGWSVHYVLGVVFAALLLAIFGLDWVRHPTMGPALIIGIGSVVAPFLLMQPGMGMGVAASRTPRPNVARLQSLITHTIFGLGLYMAGRIASLLFAFS
jgi:Protein of unknown function (DUF2938)